eukprot:TRINITY_DN21850_c0_g2_i1.p2 TRINITY_DN21850_c0_g2~~TRINITY_DN21850_c0_g2_i1.p2  ORF type:complete len:100 (+),score=24.10 TRINITY_DN21850_c0_g2_i1:191-490(+)
MYSLVPDVHTRVLREQLRKHPEMKPAPDPDSNAVVSLPEADQPRDQPGEGQPHLEDCVAEDLSPKPRVSPEEVVDIVRQVWGLNVSSTSPLPSLSLIHI